MLLRLFGISFRLFLGFLVFFGMFEISLGFLRSPMDFWDFWGFVWIFGIFEIFGISFGTFRIYFGLLDFHWIFGTFGIFFLIFGFFSFLRKVCGIISSDFPLAIYPSQFIKTAWIIALLNNLSAYRWFLLIWFLFMDVFKNLVPFCSSGKSLEKIPCTFLGNPEKIPKIL